MKKERTLLLVLLFAACQVVAQQQTGTPSKSQISSASASRTNSAPASTTFSAPKPKLHLFGPAQPVQQPKRLQLVEGLDPRAWTTVAETGTSRLAFPDGHTHRAGLCLLWWGSEPRPQ